MPIVTLIFVLAVCIGIIAFVVVLIRLLRKNARDLKALQERGVPTSATVVGHSITRQDEPRRRTTYWLKLEYTANNAPYEQSIWVSKDAYDSFPDGSSIDILYLPEDPKVITRK
jgi:hypothetical protein